MISLQSYSIQVPLFLTTRSWMMPVKFSRFSKENLADFIQKRNRIDMKISNNNGRKMSNNEFEVKKDKLAAENLKQQAILNSIGNDRLKKDRRKSAMILGASLILMAVLAGISIPSLGTTSSSFGLVSIFFLDILVSILIIRIHKIDRPKLAWVSGVIRLVYTVVLGIAIAFLIGGNIALFEQIWGIGLIGFGVHLICLGFLFNFQSKKKWIKYLIKSLLPLAGLGYVIWYIGILIVPNVEAFERLMEIIFIAPMILGEIFYAFWMLIKGGK